jgi:hypothetical protein
MASLSVKVPKRVAASVLRHLVSRPEMVAFLRGTVHGDVINVDDVWLLDDDDLVLSHWHVSLTDEARQQVLTWAVGAPVLVEAHSHGPLGGPAGLSSTDLDGLANWVAHLSWRLPGLIYVALVHGADSFDGLVWYGGEGPNALHRVTFDGEAQWLATGRSIARWQQSNA